MIDIHSHILPGVDDGASSMKESLHMLSMARRQGITDVFATSHYSKAFPNRDPEKLRRLRDELMSRANRSVKGPDGKIKRRQPIRIWTGQEIFLILIVLYVCLKREDCLRWQTVIMYWLSLCLQYRILRYVQQ